MVLSQNAENGAIVWPCYSDPERIHTGLHVFRQLCSLLLHPQQQGKGVSPDVREQIVKVWCTDTAKLHSATESRKVMKVEGTLVNLETILIKKTCPLICR